MSPQPWYRTAMRLGLCTLAVLISSSAAADTDWIDVDRVAIVVDRDIVLASEVELELSRNPEVLVEPDEAARAAKRKQLRPRIIDLLIERALTLQKAKVYMISVENSDVEMAIDEIKKQNQLDDEGLNAALVAQNWTMPEYRVELGYQLLRLRVINQLVRPKIMIGDVAIRAEYDRLVKDGGTGGKSFDDLKSEIGSKLTREALDAESAKTLAEWRAAAYVDVRMP
jgi:peptidyl-prolyl cis-trans isomerase SurA